MPGHLDDVWNTRDYPVLLELTRLIDEHGQSIGVESVVEATGLDPNDVQRAGRALERRGLVSLQAKTADGSFHIFGDVAGSAYLLTGLHPDGDDALSQLITALRQAADSESDEEERGRLRRAADALGGIGRDIGAGVLTAVLTRYATGG